MVPKENIEEVVSLAKAAVEAISQLLDNEQYTAMVNDRHYQGKKISTMLMSTPNK